MTATQAIVDDPKYQIEEAQQGQCDWHPPGQFDTVLRLFLCHALDGFTQLSRASTAVLFSSFPIN